MITDVDEVVILGKVRLVQSPGLGVVSQELPSDWKAECIEAIVIYEVLHLSGTIMTYAKDIRRQPNNQKKEIATDRSISKEVAKHHWQCSSDLNKVFRK